MLAAYQLGWPTYNCWRAGCAISTAPETASHLPPTTPSSSPPSVLSHLNAHMWMLFRILSAAVFLFSIVFTIPLAFDVGGRTCGLAFSLTLASFYFLYSTLRISTPEVSTYRRALCKLIQVSQWIVIPTLMIWSLNKFSVDGGEGAGWVERTFGGKRAQDTSIHEWLFGRQGLVESSTIGAWDKLLRWSTPVFQMSEGFCSLLVIQAAGQITRYLVNQDGGDGWMIGFLVMSASVISSSVYFLWRITTFPEINNVDAILIGIAITCAFFLCAWGIGSGRGNPVESSLLVSCTNFLPIPNTPYH